MLVGAKAAIGDFNFSGLMIDRNIFKVTGVYAGRPLKASGLCKLTRTAKGRVATVDCKAESEFGIARMKSTADNPDDWDLIVRRIVRNGSSAQKP